jgi:hypothetical protein
MNADQAKSFDIEVSNILESAGFKNEVTGIVSFKVTVADIANP